MECKEVQKLIPAYLNEELEGKIEENFLKHIENCKICKEELCIQYLVIEGTARLETGNSFDLNTELNNKIISSKKMLKRKKIGTWIIYILEFTTIIAVMFILFLVFYR